MEKKNHQMKILGKNKLKLNMSLNAKLIILFLMTFEVAMCQKKHQINYGDTQFMIFDNYTNQFKLKENIEDGTWLVYYDNIQTDTAIYVKVVESKLNGKCYFFEKGNKYRGEFEYKDGLLHGISREIMIIEGNSFLNIQRWENGALDEIIQKEW